GDALAVREAAAREHGGALERAGELVGQAALADAWLAVDREQVRAAVAHGALVGVPEQIELGLAPDERRLDVVPTSAAPVRPDRAPGPDGLGHALDRDRPDVLDLDSPERQPVGSRAEQQLAGLGRLLEPRSQRDRLARRERGLPVFGDDLARLDAYAGHELELVDRLEDREPRA